MSYVIDQIKSKINISSLVSKRVALKRRATGEYIGLCPFHREKSPSFYVSDNKKFYHCFGCGAHGDIFSYLMQAEYLDFKETLEQLAKEAGVTLPKHSYPQKQQDDKYNILVAIYEHATNYYVKKLSSLEGKQALDYFKRRGLREELIAQYRLGFAPSHHDELYNELKIKFSEQDILDSRVISKGNYGFYNAFKNRAIFPIFNPKGQTIAFGGRILTTGEPKYLNSSETLIFKKHEVLYNLNFAKKQAARQNNIIIVEGYMDTITLAGCNIDNVVAPLGTSISIEHMHTLWKMVDTITLCLDSDRAGKTAAFKLALEVLPYIKTNKTINFVMLKGGKDPDEIIMHKGKEFLKNLLDQPIPLSEFLFLVFASGLDLSLPENIAKLRKELEEGTKKITDYHLQKAYQTYFKGKIFELSYVKKKAISQHTSLNQNHYLQSITDNKEINILTILVALINHPTLLFNEEVQRELYEIDIKSNFLDSIRNYILNLKDYSNNAQGLCSTHLRKTLEEHFNFEYNDQEFDRFAQSSTNDEEALRGIIRIFKLSNLVIIQNQIEHVSRMLMEKQDEITYEKLHYLKKTEEILKTELNIIN